MKTVISTIDINNSNISLQIEIERNGEIIHSEKGNCLLDNFLKLLHTRMSGNAFNSVQAYTSAPGTLGEKIVQTGAYYPFYAEEAIPYAGIIVGSGTDAVTLADNSLQTLIVNGSGSGQLLYGTNALVSAPAEGADYIQITVSKPFTNSSGAEITVNEVALVLMARYEAINQFYKTIAARDVLSTPLVIPAGITNTINYRIRVTKSALGGFTRQFMDLLYRQMKRVSHSGQDINNASQSGGSNNINLQCFAGGGIDGVSRQSELSFLAENVGVVVGAGSTAFTLNDYALASKLSNAQLKHYGGSITPITIGTSESKFAIERIFQNISGSALYLNEGGLYMLGSSSSNYSDFDPSHIFCAARNVYTDEVELLNNEYFKQVCKIAVSL